MSSKRPPQHRVDSDSPEPVQKRKRTSSPDAALPVQVYLVDAKMDAETVGELTSLVERYHGRGGQSAKIGLDERELCLCTGAENADIIITAVHMRKRLERHIDWNLAKQKAIVNPRWLRDCVKQGRLLPCGEYAALGELHDDTIANCPKIIVPHGERMSQEPMPSSSSTLTADSHVLTTGRPSLSLSDHYKERYSCRRQCPLICANQDLVKELAILRHHRELEGLDIQALSYERAISVLKAYPHVISSENLETEVANLPHVGEKIYSKIQEYVDGGEISECKTIQRDPRYQSLSAFTNIHGIGPVTARKLYSIGLRTLEHLDAYYEVTSPNIDTTTRAMNPEDVLVKQTPNVRTGLSTLSVQVGLALREDLNAKISRDEVEEMHKTVMSELGHIRTGCVSTITGGYRRGKIESNDVDIVISHRDLKSGGDEVKGLCTLLVQRLYDKGLVTHVMHLSGFREHNALRTSHWDSLEKAMTVFILPRNHGPKRIHRRLDLIFAAPEVYWTAVTGWTGSKMFERDLRLWAKQERGMKFDSSGISRRHDSKLYFPKSEREVFELLGLEWIDPTLRNADL